MTTAAFTLHPFYEAASLASLVALAMRNQLTLRCILLMVYLLLIVGDLMDGASPLGEYVVWNGIFFAINLYVLVELISGRTTFWLSPEERRLYALMGGLSPGDFRKLTRSIAWRSADDETTITVEGVAPDRLFFVYEGAITVSKGGRETPLEPHAFVGEIAFLTGGAASASVRVAPQTRWIEWPVAALNRQLERDDGLRTVIMRLIGEDLAQKVARA